VISCVAHTRGNRGTTKAKGGGCGEESEEFSARWRRGKAKSEERGAGRGGGEKQSTGWRKCTEMDRIVYNLIQVVNP